MDHEELLDRVRSLRERSFTPTEVARALGVRKAEAARLIRLVASERAGAHSDATDGGSAGRVPKHQPSCWVSPGWRNGLQVDGRPEWPDGGGAPSEASDSGVASVLVAAPDGRGRQSVCGFLVDTWCLGVKNALGPERMSRLELEAFKRHYFEAWASEGVAVPLVLAQDLVLGAIVYARSLGFEPHRDFKRARRALGHWDGPGAITFGRDGKPCYMNGPYDVPERVLATLERAVGRDGFDHTVSTGGFGELREVA